MQDFFSLELTHTFNAPADRLFAAWVTPAQLQQWFCPIEQATTPHAENDLRTGGDYRIDVQTAVGDVHQLSGLYHQIAPPRMLAFTWRWGDETDADDTYVELTFDDAGGQTTLTVLHDEFLTEAERDKHEAQWRVLLPRLAQFVDAA